MKRLIFFLLLLCFAGYGSEAYTNRGIAYGQKGEYEKAMECYQAVLDFFPMHRRARLYHGDARAAVSMFYDEDAARREAKMKQVLMQPVTEISCSPRVRAAMTKLGIYTIGDLAGKEEEDFLSVPNFGRTSLREIKEILTEKDDVVGMKQRLVVVA